MTITIKERPGKRRSTYKPPSETREYRIAGVSDSEYAKAIALAVEYADRGDELDHADWLDARLVE